MINKVRFFCEHCQTKFFAEYNPKSIHCPACKKVVLATAKQSLDDKFTMEVEIPDGDI